MALSQAQHEARSMGIGGSEAAVVCGLSPFKTPVQLWQEKTGRVPPPDLDNVEHVQWGSLLEDVIADEWARRRGEKVQRVNVTLVHPTVPYMVGNIDRRVVGKKRPLEVKNASQWSYEKWGASGTDEIPMYYMTQGLHYMAVMDADACEFGVLLGGNELRHYTLARDRKIEQQLIDIEGQFWDCVVKDSPPKPIVIEDLARLYPKTQGAIQATEEVALLVGECARLAGVRKEAEKAEKELKLQIGLFMAGAGDLLDPHDLAITIATYRSHPEKRIDSKTLREKYPDIAVEVERENIVRKFLVK